MALVIELPAWAWIILCAAVSVAATTRAIVNIYKSKHLKAGLKKFEADTKRKYGFKHEEGKKYCEGCGAPLIAVGGGSFINCPHQFGKDPRD